jgi:hypothetical protein
MALSIPLFPVALLFWPSLQRQYAQEHLRPWFVYLRPEWEGGDQWAMIVEHYGPKPVSNVRLQLQDIDRKFFLDNPKNGSPEERIQATHYESVTVTYPQVDRNVNVLSLTAFLWPALDSRHQWYAINSVSDADDGWFYESLKIESVQDSSQIQVRVMNMQDQSIVLACDDPLFPSIHYSQG